MKPAKADCIGFLLPHPPVLVPAVGNGREGEAAITLRSMNEAASRIAAFAPDTVVVISPHAPLYRDYLFAYAGNPLSGSFSRFGAGGTRLEFTADAEFSECFLSSLGERGIPCGSRASGRDEELDHGVLVPLWFISRAYAGFSLVALSQSALPEADILATGECLARTARELGRRACVVASGDMSHRVSAASPYGMVPEGRLFDEAVCGAFRSSEPAEVRAIDPAIREAAGECGYRSIVMLLGALPNAGTELLSYEAPFGIGYCVAEFTQREG